MSYKIVIEGKLPGLNEMTAVNRYSPYKGAAMKKNYTYWCEACARKCLGGRTVIPPLDRVDVFVRWVEADRRRDPDNIQGGLKFIMDGLVAAGAIPNDSQRYVRDISSVFETDGKRPRIEVWLLDAKGERKAGNGEAGDTEQAEGDNGEDDQEDTQRAAVGG